jgi:UDPglucose 6-dehydrogenase
MMARIAVIGGAGYVGLTYAAALAEIGHEVVGLDLDAGKVQSLGEGRSPIFEPGLEELIQKGLASKRLRFTTEYTQAVPDAEFCYVCVGTPSDASGRADMQYVAAAAAQIGAHGRGHTIVVNKSTLPVGSARFVLEILAEHARPDATFAVVSNPEFLREGCALRDVFQPDRIVLGADAEADARRVAELYGPLHAHVLITDPRSAEMIKYASNAFLASKISFVNEVALICERLGADVSVVAEGMGLDERIGRRFLQAGAGFGGSCFPKDVKALASMARDAGLDPSMLNAVLGINNTMRRHVVQQVADRLGGLTDKTVALLGLAFKPDTDDIREAPALAVIRQLLVGEARVRATDPVAMPHVAAQLPDVALLPDPYAAATGADAVVLMTEWAEYRMLDLDRLANCMRGRLLVDARNVIAPAAARAAGLEYVGIGRALVAEAALPKVSAVISRPHPVPVEDVAVQPTALFAAD